MTHPTFALRTAALALLLTVCASSAARAAADPNGTWKWTFTTQNGQEMQFTVTLKAEGDKLTGKVTRNDQSTDITDGTFKNDEVAFNVERERNGQKFVSKYKGKVEGEAINGKIEIELGGETRSFDWKPTREKK
jgi:major membrane immunogen (membrane-anchored lipoprotein)